MPLPLLALPALAGTLGPLLATVIRWVFLAHLASFIVRAFALIGLSIMTNELLLDPALALIQTHAGGLPGELAAWMDAFGFDNVLSIIVSAYTMLAAKKLFLGKSA